MVKKAFENTEVKTFQNGTSAFSYFDSTDNIDLVFTDITMPGMSGDQLALKIKERRKEIVVIGVSGMEPSDNLLKVFDLVLTKPITTAFLKESVERILGKE